MSDVQITDQPIDVSALIESVKDDGAGAIDVFIGTVRNQTGGKGVQKLFYEAYVPMAISEMQKIVDECAARWPVKKAGVIHRTGELGLGDIAVAIAVSCPHRADAFEACRFIIDTIKKTVPIWKKEFFNDGEESVSPTP